MASENNKKLKISLNVQWNAENSHQHYGTTAQIY